MSYDGKERFTSSEFNRFLFCQVAWMWEYYKRFKQKKSSEALAAGNVAHLAIEEYLTKGTTHKAMAEAEKVASATEKEEGDYIVAACVVPIVAHQYLQGWKKLEVHLERDLGPFVLSGKVDWVGIKDGVNTFIDYKYTGRPSIFRNAAHLISLQLNAYVVLTGMPGKYFIIESPQIRPRKDEDRSQFAGRFIVAMNEKERYTFIEAPAVAEKTAINRMLNAYKMMQYALENKCLVPNTANCYMCPYKLLCVARTEGERNSAYMSFDVKEGKHEELKDSKPIRWEQWQEIVQGW